MPSDLGLSFLRGSTGTESQTVADLLAALEVPTPAPAPQIGTGRNILGTLGDALLAYATVRAGGAPPSLGPFAQQILAQQQRAREEAQAAATYNRDLRNRIRIGQFERGQEQAGRERLESMKSRIQRSEFVRDTQQGPRRVRQLVDMRSGEILAEDDLGAVMVPEIVSPGVAGGQAALGIINRRERTFQPVRTHEGGQIVEPVPTEGFQREVAAEESFIDKAEDLYALHDSVYSELSQRPGIVGSAERYVKGRVGRGELGGILQPEVAKYNAALKQALFTYVKKQTGAQFSITEMDRYEAQFPFPWDPPDVARNKIDTIVAGAIRDIRARYGAAGRTIPSTSAASEDPIERVLQRARGRQ